MRCLAQAGLLPPGGELTKMFADRLSSDTKAIEGLCSDADRTVSGGGAKDKMTALSIYQQQRVRLFPLIKKFMMIPKPSCVHPPDQNNKDVIVKGPVDSKLCYFSPIGTILTIP
jgi:hypothetical protein